MPLHEFLLNPLIVKTLQHASENDRDQQGAESHFEGLYTHWGLVQCIIILIVFICNPRNRI